MNREDPPADDGAAARPFVAPCRDIAPGAPLRWLAAGWRDMRAAPGQSLGWGLIVLALSWAVSLLALWLGSWVMMLSLLSGFVFIGPLLAIALYTISWQLELGRVPTFDLSVRTARDRLGDSMVFALVLLVIFLVWARAGSMVHVFFPIESRPEMIQLVRFLAIGSAVGSIFAAIAFAASAFSLPMLVDREVDTITAVISSANAALRNKPAMAVWLGLIVVLTGIGFATAFVGLLVLFPLLGHATWHAYRETIDASAWPQHDN
ncbi:DUF2189 domain-containing protein [Thioalkalivibrio sp. XN279]|uniref:DUF2189 domain-containing protein n=1 Tax=Thioalkalivibrio sp. XN279 TaxID=2714953 RepID=UPI00351AD210